MKKDALIIKEGHYVFNQATTYKEEFRFDPMLTYASYGGILINSLKSMMRTKVRIIVAIA
jgi:hypothetical protein